MTLRDLRSKRLIVIKGLMFVCLGLAAAILVLMEQGSWWKRVLLLAVCIWAFCRAYYFAFYVLEHYVAADYKYSGLLSAVRYLLKRPGPTKPSERDPS